MPIATQTTHLPGVILLSPDRIQDERGYFSEVFKDQWFRETVAAVTFVQENQSLSRVVGTLRGLHFQSRPFGQGKLVRCDAGALFDVAVDIRAGSPTKGQWFGAELSAENGRQLWIPEGFAHGFCTLLPDTIITYKVTSLYSREHDFGMAWDDPDVGIDWPAIAAPETLSQKDRQQPRLATLAEYFTFSEHGAH